MTGISKTALALALMLAWSARVSAQVNEATVSGAPIEESFAPQPPTPEINVDDPRPSTGVGLIVAGWIVTGVGLLNFATLPLCSADFYPSDQQELCTGLSVGIGSAGVAIGIPMLIIGYSQRSDYKAWRERNPYGALEGVGFSLQSDALFVSYRGQL